MFRLGIIGSDNSHAEAFTRLANVEGGDKGFHIEDVQVRHIFQPVAKVQTRLSAIPDEVKSPAILDLLGERDSSRAQNDIWGDFFRGLLWHRSGADEGSVQEGPDPEHCVAARGHDRQGGRCRERLVPWCSDSGALIAT